MSGINIKSGFKLGAINHVGIAVPCIEEAVRRYRDTLNVTDISAVKTLPEQGVKVAFVNLPTGQVELIEPYGDCRA